MEAQSFEILRLPRVYWDHESSKRWLAVWVALFLSGASVLGWIAAGLWLCWVIYRMRMPAQSLRLTETHLSVSDTGLELTRGEVEEIYPSTKGLTIAWRRKGVARYTDIREMHFAEAVWAQARAALLKWGNTRA